MEDADYYAFCDQDDIWLPNKIERAVRKLEEANSQIPTMYCSNYDYYDEQMKYIGHSKLKEYKQSFQNALVECIYPGMTMVINHNLRDKIVENKMTKVMYHDWIAYLIATGIGTVIYDEEVTVCYRRHGKNVSCINQNFFQFQKWRIEQIIKSNYFKKVKEQLIEFETIYGESLKEDKKELLKLLTEKQYHMKSALQKAFYPGRFRQSKMDDILMRVLFLPGII